MVMPLPMMKVTCKDCGWTGMGRPPGDVVLFLPRCGKCGGTNLGYTSLELDAVSKVVSFLKRRL